MDRKGRIKKVCEALENNRVSSIEFYKDGSGACFHYIDPTGDHGLPCAMSVSFNIEEAIHIVAGFRLKQHEIVTCS